MNTDLIPNCHAQKQKGLRINASLCSITLYGVPKGVRTPVTGVKGQCPRPLDDGDI